MPISQEAMKIVAAFQRYNENSTEAEIEGYSLEELRRVNQQLGNRDTNADYRLTLKDRISELEKLGEKLSERKYESKIRAWQLFVEIIAALVIAGLIKLLYGT